MLIAWQNLRLTGAVLVSGIAISYAVPASR